MGAMLKTLDPGDLDYDVLTAIFKILNVDVVTKGASLSRTSKPEALEVQSSHSDDGTSINANPQLSQPESWTRRDGSLSTTASISGLGTLPREDSDGSHDASSIDSQGSHKEMIMAAQIQAPVGEADRHAIQSPEQGPVAVRHVSPSFTHIECIRDEASSAGGTQQSMLAGNRPHSKYFSQVLKATHEQPRPCQTEKGSTQHDKGTPRFGQASSRVDFMIPSSLTHLTTV
jgi:hypothetical protein